MNFQGRLVRSAIVGWALYLVIALSAFALHWHASHETSSVPCAICLAQNVTGAVAVVAVLTLIVPSLKWRKVLWSGAPDAPVIAPATRRDEARGPPVKVFFLTS